LDAGSLNAAIKYVMRHAKLSPVTTAVSYAGLVGKNWHADMQAAFDANA
jgi:hypothetical protein